MDEIDIAQELEKKTLEAALSSVASALRGDGHKALVIDGVPCCRLCGDPIDPRRLRVFPETSLCIDCMTEREEAMRREQR